MPSTLPKKSSGWNSRATTLVVWALCTALVATAIGIAAHDFGAASGTFGLAEILKHFPLAANAGALVITFLLFVATTWNLLRESKRLRAESTECSRLALVAAKTDNAAFITNPDGNIQWVNDGFVRLTGHALNEALGKQPGPLLLGQLQNIKVTQKIRDGITHRRIFTVEMLCSNRRGHRFWMSLNMTPVVDEQGQVNHFIGIGSDITARRKAEEEVAKVGRRSELLLNAAADGILGFDLQGNITFLNASATRLTGFEADDLVGQPLSAILSQLKVNRAHALQDELFAGAAFIDGSVQIGETDEFRRKDGGSFPVEYSSTPVNEGTNLIGSVVVFRDVTARAESDAMRTRQMRQAALRADVAFALTSGDSLRSFLGRAMLCLVKHLEGAFARVWTLNTSDNMLELQASAGIYSHINGQHSRIPVGTLKVGKIAQDRAPQTSENLLADPDILDKEWVARERMVSFIGFPLFLEGNLVGVMAMYSRQRLPADAMELFGCVSESLAQGIVRKQAEESGLRQSAILDKATDAIVVIGLDDRIVNWNAAADRLYGWNGARPAGRFAFELLTPDKPAYERAKSSALQSGEWHDEFATILREGQPVPVDSRWSVTKDPSGEPESIVVVLSDISVRHELEKRLLAGQRNETIGLLARGLAHQLTDALSPILVSTQTLRARLTDDPANESLGLLENNARRGLELVQQVLAMGTNPEEGFHRLAPLAMLETVAGIVHGTFPKTIQIRAEAEENLWTLHGDAVLIQQTLLNFAHLARLHLPEGGVLTLTVRNAYLQEGAHELPQTAAPGWYTCFSFEHTGQPLTDETLAALMAPLDAEAGSPAPASDLDRSLQSARQILRRHRGFVGLGDSVTPGSVVHVYLPAEQPAGGHVPEPQVPDLPSGNGELILVVDDEESLLAITKEALESFGYRALTARDGAEAVAAYSAHRDEIRAVITDMLMPNMDGPSTIRVLRKLDPTVPIIASSGMLEPDKVRELTGLNDLEFLPKPYTADTLSHCVHRTVYRAA
jgi:PAS domain S-box-containing protein